MTNKPKLSILVILLTLVFSTSAKSQERGSLNDAKSMAEKAVAHIQTIGPEQAFDDFQNPASDFIKNDLYVFVNDMDCTFLAHGLNPKLVGRNIWNLKNPSGRYACRDIAQGLSNQDTIWTEYIFNDPITQKLAWKKTYSIRYKGMIINVGAYNPTQKAITK
ncbi:cache domain-containing protein [Terasakiella sp. A23]|uniref:cache domain-containing protein n=1 Tax=Terasakiella sp. FCG-A23 TaxID=3080561 RepID=UPI00295586AB|nr:cache domain-containing protein [Terasakiella sp. A23]MDV7341609.1 cache domain-containing protein [Terasakiella sp. A23]